jgi:hypothetical protein
MTSVSFRAGVGQKVYGFLTEGLANCENAFEVVVELMAGVVRERTPKMCSIESRVP